MKKRLTFAVVLSFLLIGGLVVQAGIYQDRQDDQAEQIMSTARQMFMRGKLASNQKIVEGLSTRNYDMIRDGADAVMALTKGQHWFVIDTPDYRKHGEDMTAAAQRLLDAAESKNIEAAALRYFDLTLNCLDCHQYIETQKY
jgi:sensor histidine kinase regulating citrate/malate metabolism